jgi:hypothetical protein
MSAIIAQLIIAVCWGSSGTCFTVKAEKPMPLIECLKLETETNSANGDWTESRCRLNGGNA